MTTEVAVIVGVVVGLVVAVALFGLIYLFAVLPELKAKKGTKKAEKVAEPENTEEEKEETVLENLEEEVLEETAAGNAVLAEEEPEEETVEEEPLKEEPAKEEPKKEVAPATEEEPEDEPAKEEPKKEVAPATEEEPEDEPEDGEEDDVEDNESEKEKEARLAAIESAPELEQGQRYNRSYKARLIQSSDAVKGWYSQIKNAALSYKGVKSAVSWRQEKVTKGRIQFVKLALRGKTLSVYLPLEVSRIKNYDVEDVSDKSVHAVTPCLLRVKKEAHVKQALELIAQSAEKLALEAAPAKKTDYVKEYKLVTTEKLVEEGLIKIVGKK